MRLIPVAPVLAAALLAMTANPAKAQSTHTTSTAAGTSARGHLGFDANEYPGDDKLPLLRKQFAFIGYWLNNPPGADHNPWAGKRPVLLRNNFGFIVVFNGRLDKEILKVQKSGKSPSSFGLEDAVAAVAAAKREGFPPGTIIFLDQEEGGRMLLEQAGYLLGWTEAVAASTYKPGVYASGQPVPDEDENGKRIMITTIQDIRQQVATKHLHPVAFWVAQDACPPAPGCVAQRAPSLDLSGTPNAAAWQYAQSPRRPDITKACAQTYNKDGNCYPAELPGFDIDLSVAASADPSHGR